MVNNTILHNMQRYTVTEWDSAHGTVAIQPPDVDLTQLLRAVMLANMPLLYYPSSGVYAVIHPNLPTPRTTA